MKSEQHPLNGFFVTGSDTGVGKTWVSCQIIKQLAPTHSTLKVRKPVESGCDTDENKQLLPADGIALFNANNQQENLITVTPFRYSAATSPDRAAQLENKSIYLKQLKQAVSSNIQMEDLLLVEGAGGFYSPIAEDGLNADLARLLGLKIIIVIEDRLGAINQSLLTIKAVESEGLEIKAVILNQLCHLKDSRLDNLSDLKKRTAYPVYHCDYMGELDLVDL